MSLRDVILEIVDDMDNEIALVTRADAQFCPSFVKTWAKQLRYAVKASEGEIPHLQTVRTAVPNELLPGYGGPRKNTVKAPVRDQLESPDDLQGGGRMVLCVGGGNDGVCAPLDNRAPIGCKTLVENDVYILKGDGQLHFSASETLKLQGQRGTSPAH